MHAVAPSNDQAKYKAAVLEELDRHPFRPPRWLRNPHLQSVAPRYLRRVPRPPFRVERWDTPDADFLDLYFVDRDPRMPTAVLLHGLEGAPDSTYICGLAQALGRHNWNVAALAFRSCGGEMNRAQRLYHSGETTDLAFVVNRLIARNPARSLYIVGYSLGGNVTAKWFGESGDTLPANVKAGAVVSAPYDLVESSRHMDHTVSRVYVWYFLRKLKPKARAKFAQYPGCFDLPAVERARTFRAFDDHATAPLHGFADAHDYYARVGCGQFLPDVRRPLLLLSAADDPFNPGRTLPYEVAREHPYLHPQFPEHGGHVGFMHRDESGCWAYWADEQIVRFFNAYHDRLG